MHSPPAPDLATGSSIVADTESTWTKVEKKKKKKKKKTKNKADRAAPIGSTDASSQAKSSSSPTKSAARTLSYCVEGALYVHHLDNSTSEDDLIGAFLPFTGGDRRNIRVHLHMQSYRTPFAWVDLGDRAAANEAVQAAKAGMRFPVGNDSRVLGVYPWRRPGMEAPAISSRVTTPPPPHFTPPTVKEWASWLTEWVHRHLEESKFTSVHCTRLQPFYAAMVSQHGARCYQPRPQLWQIIKAAQHENLMLSTTGQGYSLSLVPRYEPQAETEFGDKNAIEQEKLAPMEDSSKAKAEASKWMPPLTLPLTPPLPVAKASIVAIDVDDALSGVGLANIYGELFRCEEIDLGTFPLMRENDFVEIGVKERDLPVLVKLANRLAAENMGAIKLSAPQSPGGNACTSWMQAACRHLEAITIPAVVSPLISPAGPTK